MQRGSFWKNSTGFQTQRFCAGTLGPRPEDSLQGLGLSLSHHVGKGWAMGSGPQACSALPTEPSRQPTLKQIIIQKLKFKASFVAFGISKSVFVSRGSMCTENNQHALMAADISVAFLHLYLRV